MTGYFTEKYLEVHCKTFPFRIHLKTTSQTNPWQNFKTRGKYDHDPGKVRFLSVQLAVR